MFYVEFPFSPFLLTQTHTHTELSWRTVVHEPPPSALPGPLPREASFNITNHLASFLPL